MQDLYTHNINIIGLRGHIRVTQAKKGYHSQHVLSSILSP